MKKIPSNADATRIDALISQIGDNQSQLKALRQEVGDLRKVNSSLVKRLDILRRWALRNIHVRNQIMRKTASTSPAGLDR